MIQMGMLRQDNTLRVWDIATGHLVCPRQLKNSPKRLRK